MMEASRAMLRAHEDIRAHVCFEWVVAPRARMHCVFNKSWLRPRSPQSLPRRPESWSSSRSSPPPVVVAADAGRPPAGPRASIHRAGH
eukprot:5040511-Pyramimonas_sp.AAC.1